MCVGGGWVCQVFLTVVGGSKRVLDGQTFVGWKVGDPYYNGRLVDPLW